MDVEANDDLSLREAAYRQLRGEILSCRLAPGARVTERQLSEQTGYGMAPCATHCDASTRTGSCTPCPARATRSPR